VCGTFVLHLNSPARKFATFYCSVKGLENFGGQGRNRTTDTRIFSPLLYQLSYLAVSGLPADADRTTKGRYLSLYIRVRQAHELQFYLMRPASAD
jgi:hypothetical protein